MVGACFRRSKAKPRRRLLLICAAASGGVEAAWVAADARAAQGLRGRCRGCERAGGSWVAASRVRLAPRRCGAPGARAVRPSGAGAAAADGKIRASCMIRGVRAAKGALSWQDIRAVHPRTAICGAFQIHGAHILPKPARFGYMAAICCHELAIFPSEAPFGMHGVKKLPRIAA